MGRKRKSSKKSKRSRKSRSSKKLFTGGARHHPKGFTVTGRTISIPMLNGGYQKFAVYRTTAGKYFFVSGYPELRRTLNKAGIAKMSGKSKGKSRGTKSKKRTYKKRTYKRKTNSRRKTRRTKSRRSRK